MATISFNEIDTGSLLPQTLVEVRALRGAGTVVGYPTSALILGVMNDGAPGAPGLPFRVTRLADVTARAGAGSPAEDMARDFLAANQSTELWMVLLAQPGSGTAAVATITLSGSVGAAGTVATYINDRRAAVNVTTSDTPASIAAALAAAANAVTGGPMTATASGAVVTLTAKSKGTLGNAIPVQQNLAQDDVTPSGLTVTIAAPSGGAGAVDVTAALNAIASTWFAYLVLPVTDATNLALVTAELERRYTATGHLDMIALAALPGTVSSLAAYGPARNCRFLAVQGMPVGMAQAPWRSAAQLTAQACFYLSQDPSRQLRTLPLAGMRQPPVPFIDSERAILLKNGISTFLVNPDGTCAIERVVSTNTTDAAGVATQDWLDIMAAAVASRIRYDWRSYWDATYRRFKLAPDGSIAADNSDNVVTPNAALASWAARCTLYERLGWIVDVAQTLPKCIAQFPPDGSRNRLQMRLVFKRIDNLMNTDVVLEAQG